MAKIKHIAIAAQGPGCHRPLLHRRVRHEGDRPDRFPRLAGYYLSDGDINLAILDFKNDAVAGQERGKDWSGIHHIGFQVESVEAIAERLAQAGSHRRDDINDALGLGQSGQRHGNVEVKYTAPDGVTVDVSETGWVGTPTFNPGRRSRYSPHIFFHQGRASGRTAPYAGPILRRMSSMDQPVSEARRAPRLGRARSSRDSGRRFALGLALPGVAQDVAALEVRAVRGLLEDEVLGEARGRSAGADGSRTRRRS